VNDVIIPPVGLLLGQADFSGLVVDPSGKGLTARSEAKKAGALVMAYGAFLNAIINFVILAFVIFLLVQGRELAQAPAGSRTAGGTSRTAGGGDIAARDP
jgi:large-conductance mechanosensitive channel